MLIQQGHNRSGLTQTAESGDQHTAMCRLKHQLLHTVLILQLACNTCRNNNSGLFKQASGAAGKRKRCEE